MKKAVILNDTRADFHHGCSRVMNVLEHGLTAQGVSITARSPLRHRWWEDRFFLEQLAHADRVIINGEGTLHHGRPAGVDLLKVVQHEACRSPVYLVNAIYQENPRDWLQYLENLAGIWVRDSRSADELTSLGAYCNGLVPDLTLCRDLEMELPRERAGTIVGDSVDDNISHTLRDLAVLLDADFLPSLSHLKRPKGTNGISRYMRDRYIKHFERRAQRDFPPLRLAKTMDDYARQLAHAELHVTGRFHGVCFSLLTQTPFVTLQSNSWKVEMLLKDLGLSDKRLVAPADLQAACASSDWSFSETERANIGTSLSNAKQSAAQMFAAIAEQ